MPTRPNLPPGYLGAQPAMSEIGLTTFSHMDPDIATDSNEIEIKFKAKYPLKITHQLLNCRTEEDVSKYVFMQSLYGTLSFKITFPCSDYYKLQLFARKAEDKETSLPNVYNYLIRCDQALCPAVEFPKQYAQWKEGCYLKEPFCLSKDMCLNDVKFNVIIPNAKAAAVVADGEWFHLEKKGNHWEGNVDLSRFKGKDKKVTLNANTEPDETKYATMLEYCI